MTGASTSMGRGAGAAAVLRAIATSTLGPFPAFLTGTLSVFMDEEIGLGPRALGIAVASLFVCAALSSVVAGSLVQRLGARWGIVASAGFSGLALLGIAGVGAWWQLVVCLVVAGFGNALASPAANLQISGAIPDHRLGTAFGLKQAAIPSATLVAGMAVPVIGGGLGWRWAFGLGAALAWLFAAGVGLAGRDTRPRARAGRAVVSAAGPSTRLGILVVLTVGGGLGAASATTLGSFLVGSGIDAGVSPSGSGIVVGVASITGILWRVLLGAAMDLDRPWSPRNAFRVVTVLLALGSTAYLTLAVGHPVLFVVGAIAGYVVAWGWMGVYHFGIVRENRSTAASATGVVVTGTMLGAGLGPLLFGTLVEAFSYRAAWATTAGVSLAAATFVHVGERWLERTRPVADAVGPSEPRWP